MIFKKRVFFRWLNFAFYISCTKKDICDAGHCEAGLLAVMLKLPNKYQDSYITSYQALHVIKSASIGSKNVNSFEMVR